MRRLLVFLFVLLFPAVAVADCPFISEGGVIKFLCDMVYDGDVTFSGNVSIPSPPDIPSMVEKTTGNLTYYVRSAGDDGNDCLTVGSACATPQAAVAKLPEYIQHTVLIDIGAGNFAGFDIESKTLVRDAGTLTVQGTMGQVTPVTGTASGTATSGNTTTCTDSGQTWMADDFRGDYVFVGGAYRIIRTNTPTSLTLIGALDATCSGKVYEVVEPKTVINTNSGVGIARLSIGNCLGARGSIKLYSLEASGGTVGFLSWNGLPAEFLRCRADGATYGFLFQDSAISRLGSSDIVGRNGAKGLMVVRNFSTPYTGVSWQRMYFYGNSQEGVYISYSMYMSLKDTYVEDNNIGIISFSNASIDSDDNVVCSGNTSHGWAVFGDFFLDLDTTTFDGNGSYGLYIGELSGSNIYGNILVNAVGNVTVSNNTLGGILVVNKSHLYLDNCTGSGNGGYGLEVKTGSDVVITGNTALTGTTGDATINSGVNTLTWSTHFDENGDVAIHVGTGSRIERRD